VFLRIFCDLIGKAMSLKILSVFDSTKATEWVATELAKYDLVQVGTIMAAMQVLQKEKVDVTLVQLHLQNESLFDLLRSIRRNDYYREMSFICCGTSDTSIGDHRPQIQAEFVEKSCLLYGATKVIATEIFYSDDLESEILATLSRPGSLSGT
jgi:DNA-binding NtrC family response regulator